MLPQPAGGRKCFPRVCQILKHRFLCYRNKQIFIFGKTMLIAVVPILINKDVSEPSYNGFKIHCLKLQLISHRHHAKPGNKMWSSCHQGTQSIRKRQTHKQLIITYWAESNKADMMLAKALKYKLIVKLDIYKNINLYKSLAPVILHFLDLIQPNPCTHRNDPEGISPFLLVISSNVENGSLNSKTSIICSCFPAEEEDWTNIT